MRSLLRVSKKRSKKAGLPSGTLVYTGERKHEKITLHVIDYSEQSVHEEELSSVEACIPYKQRPTPTWINMDGVHDAAILERFGDCFGLHGLVMEDIMNTDQRAKVEDYGEYLYFVLKMISSDRNSQISTEQVSIILGPSFVLSFQEGLKGDVFQVIRDRIRTGKGRVRKAGPDYLVYSLVDAIVDNYFVTLEKVGDRIEDLETELIESPTQATVQKIYHVKRELIFLHNAAWPLREMISSLAKLESPLISPATMLYVRDVYDHVTHVMDSVYIYREMVASMLDMYLSSVSNRLNEVMKVLTVIATIFMPLTFVAGVYGMNFKYMPELGWKYGYLVALGIMAGIAGAMLFYFKRKKWL